MQPTHGPLVCAWCHAAFSRRCRRGRVPRYCRRTCRQRAYEGRRREAFERALPRRPATRPGPGRPAYESGEQTSFVRHALRADGAADEFGWRPTLCGTRAAVLKVPFEPWQGRPTMARACQTCWAVAERFPAPGPPDVSNDLARARAAIARLRSIFASRPSTARLRAAVAEALVGVEGTGPPRVV